jgi:enoyl-CoA hydratase
VLLRMAHGKANALDTALLRALRDAMSRAADSEATSLVLTGSGRIFSAGVDLLKLAEGGRTYLEEFLPQLSACLRELFTFPKPAVAAVNGHAIAGGCLLACACDHRLMARGSGRIGVPELRVGLPFPLAALEILRFVLPPHRAQEVVLLGGTYEPEQALERGLLDAVVEPERLHERAAAVADDLAQTPAASFLRAKLDLRRPVMEAWARHAAAHDRETLEAWDSPRVRSAVAAYVERTLRKQC